MFVDRKREMAFLNGLLARKRPTRAQMVLLYGRRRVGKTVLARQWAEQSGVPVIYWAAEREPAPLQRRKLFAQMLGSAAGGVTFGTWDDLWAALVEMTGDRRQILILDEVPHAAESDPAFLSSLQHTWDQRFKQSGLVMLLCGSHVRTMETLLAQGSPLFGRFTGQWHLQPLAFGALRYFLPHWQAERRVAAYAIVGGVPAYLEWLHEDASLIENLRDVLLAPGSIFMAEPELLLYDEVHEPRVYHAILQAIGAGAHTLDEIANAALVGKTHLAAYLVRLQELHFVERRVPVTVPPGKRASSRMGRYHLADPFLRFYYRFIAPQREEVGYRLEKVLPGIQEQLRTFVGATAFEDLCRTWVEQASGKLPFAPERVGSHWSRSVQADVVAVNWREKRILIGECKWGADKVAREVLIGLIEKKGPLVLKSLPEEGHGWKPHYALFSRAGVTPATQALAREREVLLVELQQMDRDFAVTDEAG